MNGPAPQGHVTGVRQEAAAMLLSRFKFQQLVAATTARQLEAATNPSRPHVLPCSPPTASGVHVRGGRSGKGRASLSPRVFGSSFSNGNAP